MTCLLPGPCSNCEQSRWRIDCPSLPTKIDSLSSSSDTEKKKNSQIFWVWQLKAKLTCVAMKDLILSYMTSWKTDNFRSKTITEEPRVTE